MPLHLPTTTRPLVVRRSALSAQSTSIEPLVDVTRTDAEHADELDVA